jgi:membrane protein DedA with SNARE-associated domain
VVLASLSGSIIHQIAVHGVYAVFALMAVDAVFPAASELVMLYAGALAAGAVSSSLTVFGSHISHGVGAYLVLALAGTLGYLLGALIGWWAGMRGGRTLVERYGRLIHLDGRRLGRAEAWFERWGNLGVLIGRVTPFVRSFVSIPAGVFEMPLVPYTLLTLIGSAIWAFALAGVGWALGARYGHVDHGFRYAEYAVVTVVAMAAALGAFRAVRSEQRENEQSA